MRHKNMLTSRKISKSTTMIKEIKLLIFLNYGKVKELKRE